MSLGLKVFPGVESEINLSVPSAMTVLPFKESKSTSAMASRSTTCPGLMGCSAAAFSCQPGEDTPDKRIKGENPNRLNDKNRAKYKWMLEDLDKGVGRILDTLNELDLARNTLVMFFSDNGAVGMSPKEFRMFRGGKFSHYEGGHRVPAVAWWPGKIKAGAKSDKLVVGFDLFPTFTEIAGLSDKNPNNLDGASFKAHLLEQKDFPNRDMFFGYEPKLGTAMRRGDWKMIVKEDKVQLFNLQSDRQETTDLTTRHPEIARSMRKAIHRFKAEVTPGS